LQTTLTQYRVNPKIHILIENNESDAIKFTSSRLITTW